MENKKGVIGILGTILLILIVMSISSPLGSPADSSEVEDANPYTEVVQELDDSINQVASNNDRMKAIDNNVESYKRQLEIMVDSYESLNNDLQKNLNGLKRLGEVVDEAQQDSNDVEVKLDKLRENVKNEEENFVVENSGIRVSPIFIFVFLLVNCVVWIELSSYYKKKHRY